MSDDELDRIQERRREQLVEKLTSHDTPQEPIAASDQEHFSSLLEEYPLVLVDFHAEWCGPCKQLEPIVADLARDDRLTVVKVDIDDLQDLAMANDVRGVPTLQLYQSGELVERLVGMQPRTQLESLIEQYS